MIDSGVFDMLRDYIYVGHMTDITVVNDNSTKVCEKSTHLSHNPPPTSVLHTPGNFIQFIIY